jgi:diguanylate cyclase (GGDEF)-like protein
VKELHSSVREVAVLQAATEMILSSMEADSVLHQILLIVRNHFGVSTCAVMLVDKAANELYVRAQNGYDQSVAKKRYKIGRDGITGIVASTSAPLYVPDVHAESRYIRLSESARSELALPLIVRDELIGVLDVESDKPDYFTDEMIGILAIFAGQAAVALENARLYSSERRRMRQIEFVNLIARSTTGSDNLDQLLSTLADLLSDAFESCDVSILLRQPDGTLRLSAHSGSGHPDYQSIESSVRDGLISQALHARQNLVSSVPGNTGKEPCVSGSSTELAIPLVSFGETMGAVVLSSKQVDAFSPEDRSVAQAAGDVCATAIRNVQLADELRRLANTDSLTGLFNQRYFHLAVSQEISRARRFNKQFSVLMFDLRNFRQLNVDEGFSVGDEALKAVSRNLASMVRAVDIVCRYSGDKFAMVLPEIDAKKAVSVIAKVKASLKNELTVSSQPRSFQAAFAQVHFPIDGASELDLLRKLLKELEANKQTGSSATA